jgi:antitoxin component of MazEF toxin-antitoxin module
MPKALRRKIREIGGSLNTTIPPAIIYLLKIEKGDFIEFYKNNGDVLIRKAAKSGR